jgi:hypothetical protein
VRAARPALGCVAAVLACGLGACGGGDGDGAAGPAPGGLPTEQLTLGGRLCPDREHERISVRRLAEIQAAGIAETARTGDGAAARCARQAGRRLRRALG